MDENNLHLNEIRQLIGLIKARMRVDKIDPVADATGLKVSRLYNIMAGKIKRFDKELVTLKKYYESLSSAEIKSDTAEYVPKSEFRKVPIVTQFAYASYSENWDDPEYIDKLEYMPTTIPDDGNYLWFIVKGESMECDDHRSIPDGSMVLARELYQKYWDKFNLEKVWVIHHKSMGIMVKKIESNSNGTIICKSYNPTVEDFPISINDINQLFYVKILHKKL